ncbi:MAG: hypothetical protein IPH62_06810 [Ignavibacteriae bacterium]|nr:hypothetical protein [Ignavibacteriota bacterium]
MKQIIIINVFTIILILFINACSDSNTSSPTKEENQDEISTVCTNPQFEGTWINEDEETRGITKAIIWIYNDMYKIHMWGQCHPEDCDWGINSVDISDAADCTLNLKWEPGFVIETQKIIYLTDGRMKIEGHNHYIDNSGRDDYDYIYYFLKL